ncbi:MAG: HipA N-terminal domain-containing protein [Janthinobacterium lividum]
MGRRSHGQTLNLWANGQYVGRWTVNANGNAELQYASTWINSTQGRPISLSLLFEMHNALLKGSEVKHYICGLAGAARALERMPPK